MGQALTMLDDEQLRGHIDSFVDAAGNPQEVDAIRWISSVPNVMTVQVTNNGYDVLCVAMKQPSGAAPKTADLTLEVDEAGVKNAITDTWPTTVSAQGSPPAIGVNVTFGPPEKQDPNAPIVQPIKKGRR